ncbi:hypothetical protein C8R44DRAFT_741223 [Mycena epipterygia]|nr:hypothetical protein C8R44DRAFT_741223 [Mycena epipterygia]
MLADLYVTDPCFRDALVEEEVLRTLPSIVKILTFPRFDDSCEMWKACFHGCTNVLLRYMFTGHESYQMSSRWPSWHPPRMRTPIASRGGERFRAWFFNVLVGVSGVFLVFGAAGDRSK